jgi:hypothetical protein
MLSNGITNLEDLNPNLPRDSKIQALEYSRLRDAGVLMEVDGKWKGTRSAGDWQSKLMLLIGPSPSQSSATSLHSRTWIAWPETRSFSDLGAVPQSRSQGCCYNEVEAHVGQEAKEGAGLIGGKGGGKCIY